MEAWPLQLPLITLLATPSICLTWKCSEQLLTFPWGFFSANCMFGRGRRLWSGKYCTGLQPFPSLPASLPSISQLCPGFLSCTLTGLMSGCGRCKRCAGAWFACTASCSRVRDAECVNTVWSHGRLRDHQENLSSRDCTIFNLWSCMP